MSVKNPELAEGLLKIMREDKYVHLLTHALRMCILQSLISHHGDLPVDVYERLRNLMEQWGKFYDALSESDKRQFAMETASMLSLSIFANAGTAPEETQVMLALRALRKVLDNPKPFDDLQEVCKEIYDEVSERARELGLDPDSLEPVQWPTVGVDEDLHSD
jgi:hypothetical protein